MLGSALQGPLSGVCAEAGPFGRRFSKLDSHAPGEWWKTGRKKGPRLMVPRDQVLAFALYTHDRGVLKLTAQLYPLLPTEPREVSLERSFAMCYRIDA